MMKNFNEISKEIKENTMKNSYNIQNKQGQNKVAINSLKSALYNYFSTYQTVKQSFKNVKTDKLISNSYFETYSETIIHFHHFFELILKDILSSEHELLSYNFEYKNTYYADEISVIKAIFSEEGITSEQVVSLKKDKLMFHSSIRRFNLLKQHNVDFNYTYIDDYTDSLIKLNVLRNSIWHGGTMILTYKQLDDFIGIEILPLMLRLVSSLNYSSNYIEIFLFNNCNNYINIDPLKLIISEINKNSPQYDKIAVLKELGRSSYKSHYGTGFGTYITEINKNANIQAQTEIDKFMSSAEKIIICPSCGANSLVIYKETVTSCIEEIEISTPEGMRTETSSESHEQTSKVKCAHCTFQLRNNGLKNLKEYGFEDMPDYWYDLE